MEDFHTIPSQSLRKPLAYSNHPSLVGKVYTWSNRGQYKNSDGDELVYFGCTGCRALNAKDRSIRIPQRKANVTKKKWESNPKVPHSCVPLSKMQKKVASGEFRLFPSQPAVRLSAAVTRKYADVPEEPAKIRSAAIGNDQSLRQAMRRAKLKRIPTKLKSLEDFTQENYPELYRTFRGDHAQEGSQHNDENAVIYQKSNMVLLASPRQLRWLQGTQVIVSDGSFRYAPRDTYQVYRIFGFVAEHHCVPLVTALLKGKSTEVYATVWKKVAEAIVDHNIEFPLFYYEPGSIAAFHRYFPMPVAKMCAFHAEQALNRRVQQLGLQTAYQEGGEVRSIVRRIGSIITVPPEFMSEAILVMHRAVDRLGVDAPTKAKLRSLVDYFEDIWVDNPLGKVFLSMLLTGPGTTNHAESYHSRQRDHFPRSHPLLGEWLVIYRKLAHHEEEQAAAVLRGNQKLRQGFAMYDDLKARRLQLRTELEHFLDGDYTTAEFNKECYRFLGRMGNLLGIGPMSRKERREARSEDPARRRAAAGRQRILHGPVAISGPEDSSSEEDEEEAEVEHVVLQSDGKNQPDSDHDLFE